MNFIPNRKNIYVNIVNKDELKIHEPVVLFRDVFQIVVCCCSTRTLNISFDLNATNYRIISSIAKLNIVKIVNPVFGFPGFRMITITIVGSIVIVRIRNNNNIHYGIVSPFIFILVYNKYIFRQN